MNTGKVILKIFSTALSVIIVVLLVFILYRVGQGAYDYGYRVFTESPMTTEDKAIDKVVQISDDMAAADIGELLERKGLIRDSGLFVIQLMLSAYKDDIKPGAYTLSTSMTPREMMQIMSAEEVEGTEEET